MFDVDAGEERLVERQVARVPSEDVRHCGEHSASRVAFRGGGHHRAHALGLRFGDVAKRLVHPRVEVEPRQLHAVGVAVVRGALESDGGRGVRFQQHRPVGPDVLAGEFVRTAHEVAGQPAAVRLVGDGGIVEAVAQDHGPAFERRFDDLEHDLRAGRLVDEQLRFRSHRRMPRIEHHFAQFFADVGAARLAQAHHFPALLAQRFGQEVYMRCLSGPVTTFEGDENAIRLRLCLCHR